MQGDVYCLNCPLQAHARRAQGAYKWHSQYNFMIDAERVLPALRKIGAKKVLVQIPEGLKPSASAYVEALAAGGVDAAVFIEPCFGACDLRDREAKALGCDALVHVGHSDLGISTSVPVVYDEYPMDFDPVTPLRENAPLLKGFRHIGLLAAIQFAGSLERAKDYLKSAGKEASIGRSGRMRLGQVLGCDCSAAESLGKADCIVFIGSGRFHPEGLALAVRKPVFLLDAETGRLETLTASLEKEEVRRRLRIEKARQEKVFAVFVSTKPGQRHAAEASELRDALAAAGKKAFIIAGDMLAPEKVSGMGIDVIVNTACPRIYGDQGLFKAVILNPEDIDQMLSSDV